MKFKYVFILLFLYSNLALAKYTFVPIEEYENEIYSSGLDENNQISLSLWDLEEIAKLDVFTAIRLSKYEIFNSDVKNKEYPTRTINLLKYFKNKELTKILIPMFSGLNYDSMQKNSYDGSFSSLYSDFIEAIANQEVEGKALIFKNRLDYWLDFYNNPTNSALETQEKDKISLNIMLLAETLHFYQMETLSDREYEKISKHFNSPDYYYFGLIAEYRNIRSRKQDIIQEPIKSTLSKPEFSELRFNNFESLVKDENYFRSLINEHIPHYDLSNLDVKIIYSNSKALLRFHSERDQGSVWGGTSLLTIKEKRLMVESLGEWRACGSY